MTGWAVDNDSPTSTRTVAIRVDNRRSSAARPTAATPGSPTPTRSPAACTATPSRSRCAEGSHSICAKVANTGAGLNTIVQCVTRHGQLQPERPDQHPAPGPRRRERRRLGHRPDTTAPTSVDVTVDGTTLGHGHRRGRAAAASRVTASTPSSACRRSTLAPGARTDLRAGQRTSARTAAAATSPASGQSFNWNPGTAVDEGRAAVARRDGHRLGRRPGHDRAGLGRDHGRRQEGGHGDRERCERQPPAPQVHDHDPAGRRQAHDLRRRGQPRVRVGQHHVPVRHGRRCTSSRTADSSPSPAPPNSTDVVATGWAIDPDTTGAITVHVNVDGSKPTTGTASVPRPDIAKKHPGTGSAHGFAVDRHGGRRRATVCLTAVNVGGGAGTTQLGCKIINAVHPTSASGAAAASPRSAGYGGAHVTWTRAGDRRRRAVDGYTVTALPGRAVGDAWALAPVDDRRSGSSPARRTRSRSSRRTSPVRRRPGRRRR